MTRSASPTLLVYRPGALGDALLALPAIAALRERFPELHCLLATNAGAVPLLRMAGVADDVVSADDLRFLPLFRADRPAQPITVGRLEVAVAWAGDPDGSIEWNLWSLGASRVVVAPSRPDEAAGVHAARYLLDSVSSLGVDTRLHAPRLDLPPSPDEGVRGWLEECGLEEPYLAVQPGSGSARKNWPLGRFAELIRLARSKMNLRIVLMLGPAEESWVDEAVGADLVLRSLPLEKLACVLARAAVYLGNDSGITHLAAALDVPGLALFGPTDPAVWGPLGGRVRVLRADDLDSLSADWVLEELQGVLKSQNCIPGRSP